MILSTPEHYPYSVRQARITGVQKHEPCDDPNGFYIGPERVDIQLEGINCTVEEFNDWFFKTEAGWDFCESEKSIIDLGGSKIDLTPGTVITVSFKDVLNTQIDEAARKAESELAIMSLVQRNKNRYVSAGKNIVDQIVEVTPADGWRHCISESDIIFRVSKTPLTDSIRAIDNPEHVTAIERMDIDLNGLSSTGRITLIDLVLAMDLDLISSHIKDLQPSSVGIAVYGTDNTIDTQEHFSSLSDHILSIKGEN